MQKKLLRNKNSIKLFAALVIVFSVIFNGAGMRVNADVIADPEMEGIPWFMGDDESVDDAEYEDGEAGNNDVTFKIGVNSAYEIAVYDYAELLSYSETKKLIDDMTPLSEYGHIVFLSEDEVSGSTASYISEWYHRNYGTESGTVFFIDMDNRNIYIFSDGANYKRVTDSMANNITDNIYTYATDGDYYTCASKAFDQIGTVLAGGKISTPMRYISNALLAISLGMFLCYLFSTLSAHAQRSSNAELMEYVKKEFKYSDSELKFDYTEKKYNPPSSSSDGGGGGGGSSGGGGGHGF